MESSEIINRNNELFAELEKYPENTPARQDLVAKIVKNNEGLVKYVAQKYFSAIKGAMLSNDDLIAEGYFGLLKAVKYFKAEKNANFSAYAGRCIENEITGRLKRERKHQNVSSLEDNIVSYQNGDELTLKDILTAPVDIEEEIVAENETQQQLAWVRKNLDRLTPTQRRVLTAKYLSGEVKLTDAVLAQEFDCSHQNIATVDQRAIAKLKKILANETRPKVTGLTSQAEMKAVLKDLILTELAPGQQRAMLCKFYTNTPKTNAQVAQELGANENTLGSVIHAASKKLCTLCDSVQDTKHLKSILEYCPEGPEKEC